VEGWRARRVRGAVINKNAGTRGIHKGARPTHRRTHTRTLRHTHTGVRATPRPGGGGIVEGPAQRSRIHHPPAAPAKPTPPRAPRPRPRVPRSALAVTRLITGNRLRPFPPPPPQPPPPTGHYFHPAAAAAGTIYIMCVWVCGCVGVRVASILLSLCTASSRVLYYFFFRFFHVLRPRPGPNGFYI